MFEPDFEREPVDGDEGPWTQLYLRGEEAYREFEFASYGMRIEFEERCSALAQNHFLTRLFWRREGYASPQSYEITLRAGAYTLSWNEGEPQPFDSSLVGELQRIIDICSLG